LGLADRKMQMGGSEEEIFLGKAFSSGQRHSLLHHWRKKRNQNHFVWAKWEEKERSKLRTLDLGQASGSMSSAVLF
jgi:hypothetical protein